MGGFVLSIDIRDRIVCVAFSSLYSKKEISSCLALTMEHELNGCLIDPSSIHILEESEEKPDKVYLSINFPYYGLGESCTIKSIENIIFSHKNSFVPIISFDKFSISNFNINKIRTFIKNIKAISTEELLLCLEISWVNDDDVYDKICSIVEPYEKTRLAISSFSQKPNKITDILSVGKRLSTNGSCSYDYYGAIPSKKDGIIEILGAGFSNIGVPKHMLSSII